MQIKERGNLVSKQGFHLTILTGRGSWGGELGDIEEIVIIKIEFFSTFI